MEAVNAKVFVKANGLNNFPSAPIIVNTGMKLIIVVITAVTIAPETSAVALYTIVLMDFVAGGFKPGVLLSKSWLTPANFSFSSSKCRMMFSESITPTSTIVPIAMAIPESATMLASTLKNFMAINTIRTATGSNPEINADARRLNTIMIMTKIVINISSVRASLSVPKVSCISSVRS